MPPTSLFHSFEAFRYFFGYTYLFSDQPLRKELYKIFRLSFAVWSCIPIESRTEKEGSALRSGVGFFTQDATEFDNIPLRINLGGCWDCEWKRLWSLEKSGGCWLKFIKFDRTDTVLHQFLQLGAAHRLDILLLFIFLVVLVFVLVIF